MLLRIQRPASRNFSQVARGRVTATNQVDVRPEPADARRGFEWLGQAVNRVRLDNRDALSLDPVEVGVYLIVRVVLPLLIGHMKRCPPDACPRVETTPKNRHPR